MVGSQSLTIAIGRKDRQVTTLQRFVMELLNKGRVIVVHKFTIRIHTNKQQIRIDSRTFASLRKHGWIERLHNPEIGLDAHYVITDKGKQAFMKSLDK